MEKYIYDDKNGLWYELRGDYYLPYLTAPPEEQRPIGVWGQRQLRYPIYQHFPVPLYIRSRLWSPYMRTPN